MTSLWLRSILLYSSASIVVVAVFWPTVQTMVDTWIGSRTFAHGLLVLPVTLYLVWCYRDRLIGVSPRFHSRGLIVLTVLFAMWWAGTRSGTLWVQQLAVLTIFPALLLTIMGMPVLRILAWPVAFIGFALPVGTSADPWLQALTARFIVTGLSALGIPHHQDGLLISLPSGIWEVEPDCSGLRYLLPGLALAYACTVLIHDTVRQRAGFLAVCAVSLILANGLRALSIILAAHLGIGMGADHRVFSYSIYGLTVVSLGWLGLRWNALTRTRALSQRPTAA